MNDKAYIEKITQIDKACGDKRFPDAIKLIEEIQGEISDNDLSLYLSLKSIKEDLTNNKAEELISNDIQNAVSIIRRKKFSKSERWSNFIVAIMSYTLIPAMPFLANWLNNKQNTTENIILSLAIYCISVALSMQAARDRMIGIILSILIFLLVRENPTSQAMTAGLVVTIAIFTMHVIDRMNRHLTNHEPYLNIKK